MRSIRSVNRPTVILVEDEEDQRAYVTSVIEAAGFRVVHSQLHSRLDGVLAETPEAIAIVSDIDTDRNGAGLVWAEQYVKSSNPLPIIFTSVLLYPNEAHRLGIPTILKPFQMDNGPLRETPKLATIADEFPVLLASWLNNINQGFASQTAHEKSDSRSMRR